MVRVQGCDPPLQSQHPFVLKTPTRYQGTFEEVEITEGSGNANRFGREACFLAHYGNRLAGLLREERLLATGVDEGRYVNVTKYLESPEGGSEKIEGVFSKQNLELDAALQKLNWLSTDDASAG